MVFAKLSKFIASWNSLSYFTIPNQFIGIFQSLFYNPISKHDFYLLIIELNQCIEYIEYHIVVMLVKYSFLRIYIAL